mgnify:CR=1 FL=1
MWTRTPPSPRSSTTWVADQVSLSMPSRAASTRIPRSFRYCAALRAPRTLSPATTVAEARRLDPNVPTSLEQTLLMKGDIERLMAIEMPLVIAGADDGIRVIGLGLTARRDEARQMLVAMRGGSRIPAFRTWTAYLMAWLDRRPDAMIEDPSLAQLKIQDDPEALFQRGWLLCDAGDHERGFDYLRRAVTKGYFVATTLAESPHFDALRSRPEFQALAADAQQGRARALAAFQEAGGNRLLGRRH